MRTSENSTSRTFVNKGKKKGQSAWPRPFPYSPKSAGGTLSAVEAD